MVKYYLLSYSCLPTNHVQGCDVPDRGLDGDEGAKGGRPPLQARLGEGQLGGAGLPRVAAGRVAQVRRKAAVGVRGAADALQLALRPRPRRQRVRLPQVGKLSDILFDLVDKCKFSNFP